MENLEMNKLVQQIRKQNHRFQNENDDENAFNTHNKATITSLRLLYLLQ